MTSEEGTGINLSNTQLTSAQLYDFLSNVKDKTKVVKMELSNNELTYIPNIIERFTSLGWLDIEGNCVETLPSSIKHCTKLQRIAAARNEISTLPREMAAMTSIIWLDLSSNQLPEYAAINAYGRGNVSSLMADLEDAALLETPPQSPRTEQEEQKGAESDMNVTSASASDDAALALVQARLTIEQLQREKSLLHSQVTSGGANPALEAHRLRRLLEQRDAELLTARAALHESVQRNERLLEEQVSRGGGHQRGHETFEARVVSWGVPDVVQYFGAMGASDAVQQRLRDECIDGEGLLGLEKDDLKGVLPLGLIGKYCRARAK